MSGPRAVPPLAWPSDAELTLPGSKSAANRLLVAAALSGRPVDVEGATPSDDVRLLVRGLRALGFVVDFAEREQRVAVRGRAAPARADGGGTIDCGNAGTALRFLTSVAAITPGEWVLTGDAAMQRRPIGALAAAWRQLGVDVADTNGCPPLRVRGGGARGGRVVVDASESSQFVSSLLLVGAVLPDGLEVEVRGELASAEYVTLTCRVLARCGVQAARTATGARVRPGYGQVPDALRVDGDWSSMGPWTCLEHLTGSRVRARNLAADSAQADEALAALLRSLPATGECSLDVRTLPDQFLDLAIVAAHRAGATHLTGGVNLRRKECDRIAVMARELARLGVAVRELPDGLVIDGGRPLRAATIDPAGDHRVAMAFALAGLLTPGITIVDPDCVAKSYPGFWRDLDEVVRARRCVAVVGMRGAGKSTFARAFAAASGVVCIDTDERFVAAHGPIAPFVAAHGWPAFRAHEAALLADALRPGHVVATGGGAIESEASRRSLRERAFVVWLDGDAPLLRARLAADAGGAARPSLTGAPPADELAAVLAERTPLYAGVAHLRVDAALPTAAQVDATLRQLRAPLAQHAFSD